MATLSGYAHTQSAPQKLSVSASMATVSIGNLTAIVPLFDQNTNTYWFPGWQASNYPARVSIDFGRPVNLSNIRLWDGTGQPQLSIFGALDQGGTPFFIANIPLIHWQRWQSHILNIKVRYIYLALSDAQGDQPIGEIEFFGTDDAINGNTPITGKDTLNISTNQIKTDNPVGTAAVRSGDALKLGINGFHWIPANLVQPFAYYREYQMWHWMEGQKGINRFSPSDYGNANYDTHYEELKSKGIRPIACLNTTPSWLTEGYPFSWHLHENKPVQRWEDPNKPASYDEFARFCWQVTARYGRKQQPDQLLTINGSPRWTSDSPLNKKKSGLNLLEFIEIWNEPDKWWLRHLDFPYFTPEQYAAMLSACYDGHEGTMGPGYGVKTADPSMKVVMAGLTNFDLNYVKRMIAWCKANRKDQRFPADVVSFHHYANVRSGLEEFFEYGVSPEQDDLRNKLLPLVSWCKSNIPGTTFWLSEFGYDTSPNSPQHAVAFGPYSIQTVQGMWLVRSYIEAIAAGVDVCFAYNLCDEQDPNGLFGSCGLVTNEMSGFNKKESWFQMKILADKLNGLTFEKDISTAPDVRIYQFKRSGGGTTIAIWSVDGRIRTIPFSGVPNNQITVEGWPKFVPLGINLARKKTIYTARR